MNDEDTTCPECGLTLGSAYCCQTANRSWPPPPASGSALSSFALPPSCETCCYSANFSYGAKVCDRGLPPTEACREWDTAKDAPMLRRLWYRIKCLLKNPKIIMQDHEHKN